MENLILRPDNTPQAQQAMALHYEIKSSLALAATAMVDFCKNLKAMRDGKLYIHIGFDSFEDYVEKAHNIHQRQRYNYIQTYEKLGAQLMSENADLGITKLQLLTNVSAIHRDEFLEENDVANISAAELKKLIEEKNGLSEQVSFFQSEAKDKQKLMEERENLLRQIKQLNEELEDKDQVMFDMSQPVDAASIDSEMADKIRAEAKAEAEKEHSVQLKTAVDEAVKKEKEKAKSKLEKERAGFEKEKQAAARQAVKEAKEKLVAEFEEDNKYILSQLNETKEKAAALEKQLALSGNKDTVKFSILFSSIQQDIAQLEQLVETISQTDPETGGKLNNALQRLFKSKIESEV